ncbi:MAG: head-tail adaptor protein [Dehalococcoidia bacterium]|nr:head-tail adaptor protein [Dehalococcoidia bacterium]
MSFDSLLINDAVILRYTTASVDAYGNPVKTWATHLTVPCRISYPKGRQVQVNTEVVPVEAVVFLEDADVTEADRITIDSVLFEILFVARLQDTIGDHHIELSLKRVIP